MVPLAVHLKHPLGHNDPKKLLAFCHLSAEKLTLPLPPLGTLNPSYYHVLSMILEAFVHFLVAKYFQGSQYCCSRCVLQILYLDLFRYLSHSRRKKDPVNAPESVPPCCHMSWVIWEGTDSIATSPATDP